MASKSKIFRFSVSARNALKWHPNGLKRSQNTFIWPFDPLLATLGRFPPAFEGSQGPKRAQKGRQKWAANGRKWAENGWKMAENGQQWPNMAIFWLFHFRLFSGHFRPFCGPFFGLQRLWFEQVRLSSDVLNHPTCGFSCA